MKKIDYENEARIFLKLKVSGEKISQTKYVQGRAEELGVPVSLAYFRKVLAQLKKQTPKKNKSIPKSNPTGNQRERHDWPAMKTEFLTGDFPSLSAFARFKSISPTSAYFRRMTKGWKGEKVKTGIVFAAKTKDRFIDGKVAERYGDIYTHALLIQIQLFELLEKLAKSTSIWKPAKGPAEAIEAARFVVEMQKAIERILPAIRGLEKLTEVNRLFDQLADEKIDITKAAIEFMRLGINLPRPMEIMLSKQQPAEPELDDGDLISDDTILARRQELLSEIEQERKTIVTERTKYVANLKERLKGNDSFAAQTVEDNKRTIN